MIRRTRVLLCGIVYCCILFNTAHTFGAAIVEKKIVVLIPSFNNALFYQKNLDSVFSQKYTNYSVIYVDDCSADGTGALVEEYVRIHQLEDKITIVKNTYNRRAMANLYCTIHQCDDQDLVVLLDGDDWFSHDQVLAFINELFTKEDVLAAHANYVNVPADKAEALNMKVLAAPTPPALFESRDFRKSKKWVWSGCRMFYAWLFKEIKLQDFIFPTEPFAGRFLPTSYDAALIWPMLEMVGARVRYIEQVLLDRNVETPINDFKIHLDVQQQCIALLRTMPQYAPITQMPPQHYAGLQDFKADVMIVARNGMQNVENTIEKMTRGMTGIGAITVVCSDDDALRRAKESSNQYTLMLDVEAMVPHRIDLGACIQALEQTKAHRFYFDIDNTCFAQMPEHTIPCEPLWHGIYAWQYQCAPQLTQQAVASRAMLVRSIDVPAAVKHDLEADLSNVGLFLCGKRSLIQ